MCTGLLPPGANPIAVKILIIISKVACQSLGRGHGCRNYTAFKIGSFGCLVLDDYDIEAQILKFWYYILS